MRHGGDLVLPRIPINVTVKWGHTYTYTLTVFYSMFIERRESFKEIEIIGGGGATENGRKETKKVSQLF